MDDREIVALYLKRQEEAIMRTDEKYRWMCLRLAGNILPRREDQEECVNDAYLGLWNTIPPKQPQRLGAYLSRITRGLAIDRWRSIQAGKRGGGQLTCALEELEGVLCAGKSPEEQLEQQELRELLDRFLFQLTDVQRRVLLRRYWYFDSAQDIARELGLTGAGVRSMLHRLRKRLKRYLEQEGVIQ